MSAEDRNEENDDYVDVATVRSSLAALLAQDKAKAEESQKAEVTTTLSKCRSSSLNSKATRRFKSLPYTMYMNSINAQENKPGTWVKFRIGSRVPIYMGGSAGNITYLEWAQTSTLAPLTLARAACCSF